jgi:branched-subunit amino acid ABC-type transport system permease component
VRDYLPYIVVGLGAGSVYAIAAMGLVVTYKTSGIFNFAHGAVGMAATYVFYSLRVDAGWPTAPAAAVAVLGVGPAMGIVIDRLLLRRLVGAPSSSSVVVSLGLLVALQGFFLALYGAAPRRVEPFLPQSTFRLPGVNVGWDQAILVGIAAASGLGLVLFFRTRFGVLTRAVVDDRDLSQLARVDAGRVTSASWIIGCAFAALSGVLLSPLLGVDAVILTLLVIQAFGAAAVGRLVSLPLTYAGALVIGVAASLSTKFVVEHPSLAGLPSSLPFIVLFAVLVFSRRGRFAELSRTDLRVGGSGGLAVSRFPVRLLAALATVGVVLPGRLDSGRLLTATAVVAFVLVFSSLGLLVGMSRQVSLCHVVFVALGATTLARLLDGGVPYLPALLLAGLILVPVGAVVAIPAIRLSGLFLALATFGFGVLAQNLVYQTKAGFGGKAILTINRPELFGISLRGDRAYYLFVLLVVLAGLAAVEVVRVTRLGRILRALADSPVAVQSLGINPVVPRVLVFCFTAFLAAVAGGLLGTLTLSVNAQTFDFFQSLLWVTVLVTAGPSSLGGAVTAAVALIWIPTVFTSRTVVEWQPVAFGVAAIFLAQSRNGLVGLVRRPDFSRLADLASWRLGSVRLAERLELTLAGDTPAPPGPG